ncbi:conserved hypothetical protein [Rhodopseudomonas palustris HaA2]|uniref:DUF4189 domain-containing protein n=1 Tax=Rhodopseudomonas palustris (strain HaA2) TaxID=316058 RepID=Q2ITU4_RHOP2|nr:conserved hypothetical protein [Rhodopseudomonas palustris HaA2]
MGLSAAPRRRGALLAALSIALSIATVPAHAAGALAVGKCGAYGKAFDYAADAAAVEAARKQCNGDCTTITMRRACAALAIDLLNPCGAHGYAVEPKISSTLNAATRKCYEYGGKECVIRAWACDAKG